jgi:Domain of unknown function (DUF4838)
MLRKFYMMFVCCSLLMQLQACNASKESWVLYKKGEALPILVLPLHPKGNETKSAQRFQELFQKITGEKLLIVSEKEMKAKASTKYIYIGATEPGLLQLQKNKSSISSAGFGYCTQQNSLLFYAPNSVNLLYSIGYFFEKELHLYYVDQQDLKYASTDKIALNDLEVKSNPSFEFRQCFFESSTDYNYNNWHGTQLFEDEWAVWGHGLAKIISEEGVTNSNELFALIHGQRNEEQYCFSSEELYQTICKGIRKKLAKNPDQIIFSISPNDNQLICECEQCKTHNNTTVGNSYAVTQLINRLGKTFPDITFSTIAYGTCKQPSSLALSSKTIVMLTTMDYDKGIAISAGKKAKQFEEWVNAWKQKCTKLYIWDYATQYTNYLDFFPNMPALQKDLQYFTRLGIAGVFEQGSGHDYNVLGDYKSYLISNWLWNPYRSHDSLRKDFFQYAYPTNGKVLEAFVSSLENHQTQSNTPLDIYGNVLKTFNQYLSTTELNNLYQNLNNNSATSEEEKNKIQKILLAICFNQLEWMRRQGYGKDGWAEQKGEGYYVKTACEKLLAELSDRKNLTSTNIYTENQEELTNYVDAWKTFILPNQGANQLANTALNFKNSPDEIHQVNPHQLLTDGAYGLYDYASGYLVFNDTNLDVSIPLNNTTGNKTLDIGCLQSTRHHIFLPNKMVLYGIDKNGTEKLIEDRAIPSSENKKMIKEHYTFILNMTGYSGLHLIVACAAINPVMNSRKSIACDEIRLY